MKKILLVLMTILFSCTALYAQTLDYSNYHLEFYDNFKSYADQFGTFPTSDFSTNPASPYYIAFNQNWSTCLSAGNTLYRGANVTMPSWGVLKLTENVVYPSITAPDCNGYSMTVDHYSGEIKSKAYFGYGIIEASIQIVSDYPNTLGYNAGSAFWTIATPGANNNEIDIIDVSQDDYLIHRAIDWNYSSPNHAYSFNDEHNSPDLHLSSTFHLYSCVWDPTGVSYYLDDNFIRKIDYATVRTYPSFYSICIDLGDASNTVDGLSMYIDSVRIFRQNCNSGNLNVPDISVYGPGIGGAETSLYPYGGLYKYNTITADYSTDYQSIIASPSAPFVFEAGATTIEPNFIADESTLQHSTVSLDAQPPATGYSSDTQISNGYFEILPLVCDNDNNGGSPHYSWYRMQAPNADSSLNTSNILSDTTKFDVYPNPAQNNITITYPCTSNGQLEIMIKDVAGRIMYTGSVNCNEGSNMQTVNISSFVAGVYFVDLTANDQHKVKKIVKL